MKNIAEWLASNGMSGRDFVEADRRWHRSAESSWYRAPVSREPNPSAEFLAAEHPGHLLVTAGRVGDTPVFDKTGDRLGRVFDLSIDKASGQVAHVLLEVGGFLGFGRRFHPLPWRLFTYAPELRGYTLPFARDEVAATPSLQRTDLEWCGAGYGSPFDEAHDRPDLDLPITSRAGDPTDAASNRSVARARSTHPEHHGR
ncbi:PRC-barrel domain-containing protein [Phenylobacterium sp.]|uniref:PRC-barrel domain-containing protein n=1 Tax=Phenylobacterium sp. TaxID=1871053 RepID=UPI0035632C9C